ncbi:MAG: aldehyde:ferredoxin oxidoreductase [Chloroflexi bacterium]|nr:MAG: aldehyde:ferredoxin oxidoreductase [Chloroflexota bacterium]MBA4374675.1 aldehyde:ferredoxin oxidoreductase [Anaerolinea sp.]
MDQVAISLLKQNHRLINKFQYELHPVVHGYTNRTLFINLDTNEIKTKPVDQKMKDTFTGGKGFCLWLLWNAIDTKTRWNDPENELVIAGGPIGGITAYPGSGKCTVVTLSPLTKSIIDSNGGGYFGPYLKFSGFDALEVQGKAQEDVIILIDGDNGVVTIDEAPLEAVNTHILCKQLTEMYGTTDKEKRGITVMSAGQAAEHVPMCGLNISYWDARRQEVRIKQAARGGAGTVLRDKHIKAIVVKYSETSGDSNGAANMELIRAAGKRINKEISDFDASQNDMRHFGTPYLVEIMNKFDILPVQNFRYGSDLQASKINGEVWKAMFDFRGPDGCWYGCSLQCAHAVPHYHIQSGPYKGEVVMVDGPEYESLGALGSNLGIFDPPAMLELCFYCDTYGIDTISAGNSMAFAYECFEKGILDIQKTGGLELTWGNAASAYELLHQMARGEGFGVVVGQGVRAMKAIFAEKYGADPAFLQDIGMEIKGMEISEYISRESLAQQGGYAMASKGPQHDEAWLIFMDMVYKQLPTFEAKAEALHYFPVWRTWFSLHGLCKLPWNDIIPESNKTAKEPAKVPEHVENYCWLYEGMSGKKTCPEDLMLQSEKVYNFQRVFNLRVGYGTRKHDYPPYRLIGPATKEEYENRAERYDGQLKKIIGVDPESLSTNEKIKLVRQHRESQYDQLMDAVYKRRGWTMNGVPTKETLLRLGIDFPDAIELVTANGG